MEPPPLVEFIGAAFAYGDGPVAIEADLRMEAGGLLGLVGPSGAGKTTLLRAVLGQLRPVRGEVFVSGQPVSHRRTRVGYVPQLQSLDWHFPIPAAETVTLAPVPAP